MGLPPGGRRSALLHLFLLLTAYSQPCWSQWVRPEPLQHHDGPVEATMQRDSADFLSFLREHNVTGPFISTLTSSNEPRFRLFLNFWSSSQLNQPAKTVAIVTDARAVELCRIVHAPCFYPRHTLEELNLTATGKDDYRSEFWLSVVAVGKTLALWLSYQAGNGFAFIETDVAITGDALGFLAGEPGDLVTTCDRDSGPPRKIETANAGVLFFRKPKRPGDDAIKAVLTDVVYYFREPSHRGINDQKIIFTAFSKLPDEYVVSCVDRSDGFLIGNCCWEPPVVFMPTHLWHAAVTGKRSVDKARFLQQNGLWFLPRVFNDSWLQEAFRPYFNTAGWGQSWAPPPFPPPPPPRPPLPPPRPNPPPSHPRRPPMPARPLHPPRRGTLSSVQQRRTVIMSLPRRQQVKGIRPAA